MDLFIRVAFYREKCTGKENMFGQNQGIGTREVTLTISEMAVGLIINQKRNFIMVYGR
jgi:hypothetical protein